jgi:hypothetical protein
MTSMPTDVFFTAARAPEGIDMSKQARVIAIAVAIRERELPFI